MRPARCEAIPFPLNPAKSGGNRNGEHSREHSDIAILLTAGRHIYLNMVIWTTQSYFMSAANF